MALKLHNLMKDYSYERFIAFDSNIEAFTLARELILSPDTEALKGRRIFIHGSSGNGKTHLQHAVGLKWKQKKRKKVVFADSGTFMRDCLYARNFKRPREFTAKYMDCDLLLLENVDSIAANDYTQAVMISVLETLFERKSTVMVDAIEVLNESNPIFSPGLIEILTSFEKAYVGALTDHEIRFFIKILLDQMKLKLSHSAMESLVFHLSGRSIRMILGTLKSMSIRLREREISLDEVMKLLSN